MMKVSLHCPFVFIFCQNCSEFTSHPPHLSGSLLPFVSTLLRPRLQDTIFISYRIGDCNPIWRLFLFTRGIIFPFILGRGAVYTTTLRCALQWFHFTVYFCIYLHHLCAASQMIWRLLEVIMRSRIELIPDLTFYTVSDWFHATFRACSVDDYSKDSDEELYAKMHCVH